VKETDDSGTKTNGDRDGSLHRFAVPSSQTHLDLVVRLQTEPLGDGAVLARSLGELLLDAESLLGRLGGVSGPPSWFVELSPSGAVIGNRALESREDGLDDDG
jgi:hypothetical protein